MVVLLFNRNEERGKELKVPHHARATLARDGNMPGVTAACLIPDRELYCVLALEEPKYLYSSTSYPKARLSPRTICFLS